jgi:hypothetical protein
MAISLLCGLLLFFLFWFGGAIFDGYMSDESGEAYAVLVTDESFPDRQIREYLAGLGLRDIISESSTEAAVDDFGVLRMIPLDSFHDEIEDFDPRNDGFAAKLRAFFVRDGKRFLFVPLSDTPYNAFYGAAYGAAKLKKQLALLRGPTVSVTVLEKRKPFLWYFAVFAAACTAAFGLARSRRLFVFQMPVLLAFGRGGLSAFVPAAILAGIWELLREPLRELAASRGYDRKAFDYAGKGLGGIRERLRPFRANTLLVLAFLVLLPVFSVIAGLPPVPVAAGCAFFFLICFLSYRVEAERAIKTRHVMFTPVLMFPVKARTFSLAPFLLPFCAGAALALFIPLFLPEYSSSRDSDSITGAGRVVSREDIERHIAFQRSFSYRSLNRERGSGETGDGKIDDYLRYYLGEDGLIRDAAGYSAGGNGAGGNGEGMAPFLRLERLTDFLLKYNDSARGVSAGKTPGQNAPAVGSALRGKEVLITAAVLLTACALRFFRVGTGRTRKKKTPAAGDKRIAA